MNPRLRRWGRNIRIGRNALRLSQSKFAGLVGVRQGTVANWEAGRMGPRDAHKLRIAELLHQEVAVLFPLEREKAA